MLVLTRKPRQQIMIGDNIVINVVEVQGENVRIAIDAPRDIKIYRGEIYRSIQEENQKAAQKADVDLHEALPGKGISASETNEYPASLQRSVL